MTYNCLAHDWGFQLHCQIHVNIGHRTRSCKGHTYAWPSTGYIKLHCYASSSCSVRDSSSNFKQCWNVCTIVLIQMQKTCGQYLDNLKSAARTANTTKYTWQNSSPRASAVSNDTTAKSMSSFYCYISQQMTFRSA